MPASTDRNLLFGIVALNLDFIDRDHLVAAMHAWLADKSRPLGQILEDQKALNRPRRVLLEALVDEHVRRHGDDPARSLAALSSVDDAREALAAIADPDVRAGLGRVPSTRLPAGSSLDPGATRYSADGPRPASPRFRVLRAHARGGLGAVFVAQDGELNRQVALKQIQDRHADHPGSRARFVLEAEITGGLEHPGLQPRPRRVGPALLRDAVRPGGQPRRRNRPLPRRDRRRSRPAHPGAPQAPAAVPGRLRGRGLRPQPGRAAPRPEARQRHGRPLRRDPGRRLGARQGSARPRRATKIPCGPPRPTARPRRCPAARSARRPT